MNHFDNLFKSLFLTEGLYLTRDFDRWGGIFSQKISNNIQLLNPYAFFIFNNEPLVLFFEETQNNSQTHQLCWNFNVTPIIFFVSENDIKIYNGFELENTSNPLLKQIANQDNISDFSFWNIASGNTFNDYKEILKTNKRVDKVLLNNIKSARESLIQNGLTATLANNLIGRLIFIRYLIDRKVNIGFREPISTTTFLQIITSKSTLIDLFDYLNKKFKGDLFLIDKKTLENLTTTHLNILHSLFSGNDIGKGQISLFPIYNFEILPIEFISNIYENFMGEDKKKSQKTYYTPLFLVNYILTETVSTYFHSNPQKDSCKVVDPTCGSGIFLVEAFRRIVGQYEKLHGKITNGNRNKLKELLQENIYGIDKDGDAINVAMFSLYITLLDYQQPREIENFEFPNLLNTNFFVQDIFDFYEPNVFDNEKDENYVTKLYRRDFQFIIGNPPWGDVSETPYMDYIKKRAKKEQAAIEIADKQFAPAFLLRTSDFCNKDTVCAVVINSKILYNKSVKKTKKQETRSKAEMFRHYFLKNFFLDRVFEMSPIRKDVFNSSERADSGAIAPAAVLFYRHAQKQVTDANEVVHVSAKYNTFYNLLKLLVLEKNDFKRLKQVNFVKNDWIWKVLLYGNALDYQFIKRLKSDYEQTIEKVISDKNKFVTGVGISVNGGDKNDAKNLMSYPFLNSDNLKKCFKPFAIKIDSNHKLNTDTVHRVRDLRIYNPPLLLLKKGVSSNFETVAAISKNDILFTDGITSIKALIPENIDVLYSLESIFSSKLFRYYQINISASIGVEREQVFHDDLFSFPYNFSSSLSQIAENIENKLKEIEQSVNFYDIIDSENDDLFIQEPQANDIQTLYKTLNNEIYDLYDLNAIEESLIDYAENVTIPLIKNDLKVFRKASVEISYLKRYAEIFFEHFGKIFNGRKGNYFEIEIRHNRFFVCMIFKVVSAKPKEIICISDASLDISFFSKLAIQEVSNSLYVQKDITVFRGNEFYIIKPNEFKCWHSAVAYNNLFEIRQSIMTRPTEETALA